MRFFHLILWQPLFNLLVVFYLLTGNLGIAIIILTLLVRVAMYPMQNKATKSQMIMQELQPEIKELQQKYKDDKEKQTKEIMALYKSKNVNPFSSIPILLIQLPLFIALFNMFREGITQDTLKFLYTFVPAPVEVNTMFLGLDLSAPSKLMGVIVAVLFFVQMKYSTVKTKKKGKKGDFGDIMQKQMMYLFPVLIGFAIASSPAGLGIYLVVGTLFLIVQQYFAKKKIIEIENV